MNKRRVLQEYIKEVSDEFGIEKPPRLVLTKDDSIFGEAYSPTEENEESPFIVRFYRGKSLGELKGDVRHELAHIKLVGRFDTPYKDAEDMVRKEISADMLAFGKMKGLEYLMTNIVHEYGFGKRDSYLLVKKLQKNLMSLSLL